jgi:PAS domain S-box-containing protein
MFRLKNFLRPTLTKKILIGFMTVSLVPVLFIGYITYKTSEKEIKKEVLENLLAFAESRVVLFNEYIMGKKRETRGLALTPTVISMSEKYHDVFHAGGADSREYIALARKHKKYFMDFINKFKYHDLLFVDTDGNVFFTVKRESDFGTNLYTGTYKDTWLAKTYRQVMETKETNISDFKHYLPSNMPALFIVTPVFNEGNIIGAVILQVSNEDINEEVRNYIGLGSTGEIVIASREGNEAVFITPLRHDAEAAFNRRVRIGSEEALPIQKAIQGENGSGLSVDYRNKEILAVWRYLPRLRWGMVIKMDTDEAYQHIYNIRKWTALVGVTTIIVVTLLAIRISRTLTKPIRALHKGSERIGHGNLDHKVGTDAKDEIGDLSRSFDEMTIKLKDSRMMLEDEITDRKKIEDVLRLYERIISSTDDHMSFINKDYIYQAVNLTYLKAHNKSLEDIVGHSVQELLGNELFEKRVKHYLDRCLKGEEVNYQAWFDFAAFGRRFMDVSYYPYYETDGAVSGVVVSSHDITELKKAENNLRKREQQLKDSQKIAHLGSWELNLQNNKIISSDELYHILDLNPEASKSTLEEFMHIVHPDDRGHVERTLSKSILEKKPFYVESRIILTNGSERIIESRGDIVCDDSGEPVLMSGIAQDVTERKKVEKQIKDALREKEILLQEIHHRVKNNMTVITSLLQLQSKGIKDKQYRDMFSDSVNRINTMAFIHEKLYRSKDMTNVNFDDYLKSMLNSMLLSYRSDSLKIELKTDIDNVSLGVNTAIPCGLIINELISNSLKHAFPEGNEGEIRVAMFTNDKAEIELTVSDNGVGIPENLDLRNTDSLGLTLVNALAAQLRGTIDLNREKGTRFVITFKG